MARIDSIEDPVMGNALSLKEIIQISEQLPQIFIHERVRGYILDLVASLRGNPNVREGPSARASIWLMKGARARALYEGRNYVIPDDVKGLAEQVLVHRIELKPMSIAEDLTAEALVKQTLESVPVPKDIK
jgi:MoxR-like ATPase